MHYQTLPINPVAEVRDLLQQSSRRVQILAPLSPDFAAILLWNARSCTQLQSQQASMSAKVGQREAVSQFGGLS